MLNENNDKQINEAQPQIEQPTLESVIKNVKSIEELEALTPEINGEKPIKEAIKENSVIEIEDEIVEEEEKEKVEIKKIIEKTLIDEDIRKKFNIPDKFKFIEDYSKWSIEAEKQMTKTQMEKSELIKKQIELEKDNAYLKGLAERVADLPNQGIDDEEREMINAKLREDLDKDPIRTFENILDMYEKKKEEKNNIQKQELKQKQINERLASEEKSIIRSEGEYEYETIIKPELIKIAKSREDEGIPLYSLQDAYLIYKHCENEKKMSILNEDIEKKEIKKQTYTETSQPQRKEEKSIEDKIKSAKSIDELDKLVGLK